MIQANSNSLIHPYAKLNKVTEYKDQYKIHTPQKNNLEHKPLTNTH